MLSQLNYYDYVIFKIINSLAGKYFWLDYIVIITTNYILWFIIVVILLYELKHIIIDERRDWLVIFKVFSSIIFVWILNNLFMAKIFFRSRPFINHNVNKLVRDPWTIKSFPSDHASIAFTISTIIYLHNPKTGLFLFPIAFLIAISRVYVGVHYPLDVLIGMFIGIILAYFINKFFSKLKK